MVEVKKIGVAAVVAVFAFAVISPVCCAEDWSTLVGHAHKTADHSHTHDDTSGCDVPLLKTMAKPDMISASHSPVSTSYGITFRKRIFEPVPTVGEKYTSRPGFVNKASPPIHLLNSVFLN